MEKLRLLFGKTKLVVAANTASQVAGKGITAGTTFLISIFIARAFGAEGFGDFIKITTFVAFFYLVADFGLNAVVLQQIQKTSVDDPWRTLLALRILGSFILIFVSLAVLAFLPQGQYQGYTAAVRLGIIIFSPTILFQAMLTTANAIFQKHLRYDLSTLSLAGGSLVSLLLIALVTKIIVTSVGPLFAVAALALGAFVTALIALLLAKGLAPTFSPAFHSYPMIKLLVASTPLALTLVFNLVYFRADSVILTLTRATSEVGIYGFAYKVFEFPLALPTFFMNSVYPLFVQVTGRRQVTAEFQRLMRRSFFILLVSSLIALGTFWYAAPLLSFVRPEFTGSIPLLRILSFGLPFFFLSSLTMWALIALEKRMTITVIYGVMMILNVVLNILFIPSYGALAAAWITVITEGLVLFVSGFVLLRSL